VKRLVAAFVVVGIVACGLPKDSALCGPNGTNTCASRGLVCSFTYGCADCALDSDCNGTLDKPVCLEGKCVACAVNDDCGDSVTSTCWSDHECHEPCTTGSCPSSMPICVFRGDEADAACVQCQNDVDCPSMAAPVCDYQLDACVECVLDSECSAAKPRCVGDRCVQCKQNADCPGSGTCDSLTFTCGS
jgi:hypothetical protein